MLPQKNRLKKEKDFKNVSQKGRVLKEGPIFLKFSRNKKEINRVGFVVSKKISKKAVTRNKIKRRMREAAKSDWGELEKGYDLIFFSSPGIEELDFAEISRLISNLIKKAGLK